MREVKTFAVRQFVAMLCVVTMAAPAAWAQEPTIDTQGSGAWYSRFTHNYTPRYVAPIDVANSSRADQLVQQGNLYLSLNDAIAMALENNVDLEVQRYQYDITGAQLLAAEAGNNGTSFDPVFTSNITWNRNQQVATSNLNSGGASRTISNQQTRNFGIQQGFVTGGTVTLGFNNGTSTTNNINSFYIPNLSSSLQLQGTQPLLNGFGIALNTRGIRVAKNNIRLSDFQFQQQLNTTVNQVIQAYWNLVSATLNVQVARQSLELAEKLFQDNQKQVDIGTLAPIEVLNAEAQVESRRADLVNVEGQVRTQETNLKNLLSRNGIASPTLANVHIVPTDRIQVPEIEPVLPIQDLTSEALANRPELAQQQIQMDNTRINMEGTRNSLLPTVNLVGNVSNPVQGGVLNPQEFNVATQQFVARDLSKVDQTFAGGRTTIWGALFSQNLINYQIGFQLNIPLRNRAAQAQMQQQSFQLRQAELQYQRQTNQIRADVQNAQIAIEQARARYQAAQKSRSLQEQVLDAEQRKLQLGASTVFQVIQYQNNLASARQTEVQAQIQYANAKLQMDVATGSLMDKYNIVFDEARDGRISKRPDPIPVVLDNQGAVVAPRPTAPGAPAAAGAANAQ